MGQIKMLHIVNTLASYWKRFWFIG